MSNEWDNLLVHLHINEDSISDNDILGLSAWCRANISEDKEFSSHQKFNEIKQFINHYFDTVCLFHGDALLQPNTVLDNMNAIQYASIHGYDQYLEKVLSQNQKLQDAINQSTSTGMTALHFAALNGHKNTLKVLVRYGADEAAVNQNHQTILHLALTDLPRSTEIILAKKLSLFHFLKNTYPQYLNLVDMSGNNITHLMAKNGYTDTLLSLGQECTELLQKKNNFGHSPLHMAILNRHFETAKVLASFPALTTLSDSDGKQPVHYAALYADAPLVKLFLDPEKIDITDHYLKTPSHFAASAGNLRSVSFLVSYGANALMKDIRELGMIHYAVSSKNLELVQWLLSNTTIKINDTDQLGRTALIGLFTNVLSYDANIETMITYLITKGADLSIHDKSGHTLRDYVMQWVTKGGRMSTALYQNITQEGHG